MSRSYFFGLWAALPGIFFVSSAHAATLGPNAESAAVLPNLVAQNTYTGDSALSQDSILQNTANSYLAVNAQAAARREIQAAETNVNVSGAFMHTQYHENLPPGTGDDENGFTAGFGVGASALLPVLALRGNPDLYTALSYDFSAGNLTYGGHYIFSGLPATATDNAVFNRIEGRIGIGFPIAHGMEIIPFLAAGYQSWNRNINKKDQLGTDEFYRSGLLGGGIKLDAPLTPSLIVSATGELFGLVGGAISYNDFGGSGNFGPTAEERISLGLDDAVRGRLHVFGTVFWQHFNYSGNKPKIIGDYYINEPLSTTTQFGANLGIAYSFN